MAICERKRGGVTPEVLEAASVPSAMARGDADADGERAEEAAEDPPGSAPGRGDVLVGANVLDGRG